MGKQLENIHADREVDFYTSEKKGGLMQRIRYSTESIDEVENVSVPFENPENALEYTLRDEAFVVKSEILEVMGVAVNDPENAFISFKVYDTLKVVSERLAEVSTAPTAETYPMDDYKKQLKVFYFDLGASVGLRNETVEYFWQRANTKMMFDDFAKILS